MSTDGDRIPGIWFHPGTRRLHVRDGHGNDGNAGCDPEEELPANTATTVRVEMRPGFVDVFYDAVLKCTEARGDRQAFDSVVVYAPDPWHTAANAAINNFFMKQLDPISGCTDALSCNRDDRASVDDGSCRYPDAGRDCDGQTFDIIAGATYFVGAVPLPLSPGVEHAIVNLPVDYEVGFDITPRPELVTEWASIIHITATGNNCCGYVRSHCFPTDCPLPRTKLPDAQGDRVPAVWFHPNTHRLHVRDGHGSDGNAGCDPEEELLPNEATSVKIVMEASLVTVFFGQEQVCTEARADRSTFENAVVFASDPWHPPAAATIRNFYLREL